MIWIATTQAEIERLEEKVKKLGKEQYDLCSQIVNLKYDVKYAKAEAIKEFAERLMDEVGITPVDDFNYAYVIRSEEIDNLVKK